MKKAVEHISVNTGRAMYVCISLFRVDQINTCFNVEFVFLGRNFDFLGSYLVATARYLSVTTG